MKKLNLFEKVFGTLFLILVAPIIPFVGSIMSVILYSVPIKLPKLPGPGGDSAVEGLYVYLLVLPISILLFFVSQKLIKVTDKNKPSMGRRVRRMFYLLLIIIPILGFGLRYISN